MLAWKHCWSPPSLPYLPSTPHPPLPSPPLKKFPFSLGSSLLVPLKYPFSSLPVHLCWMLFLSKFMYREITTRVFATLKRWVGVERKRKYSWALVHSSELFSGWVSPQCVGVREGDSSQLECKRRFSLYMLGNLGDVGVFMLQLRRLMVINSSNLKQNW